LKIVVVATPKNPEDHTVSTVICSGLANFLKHSETITLTHNIVSVIRVSGEGVPTGVRPVVVPFPGLQ
jgi:hypothetical protein